MRTVLCLSGLVGIACMASLPACGLNSNWQEQYDACVASVPRPASLDTAKPAATPVPAIATPDLVTTSIDEVNTIFREGIVAEMQRSLDQSEYSAIVQHRCGQIRQTNRGGEELSADNAGSMPPSPPAATPSEPKQVSGTNTQVAGVDEADFVKNDSEYLYIATGSTFRIIDAWPAAETHEVAQVAINGKALKSFVLGNRAVIYSSLPAAPPGQTTQPPGVSGGYLTSFGNDCSYGYNCTYQGDGSQTEITVVDLTDHTQPKVIRTIRTASSLITARRIGNTVHTVVAQSPLSNVRYYGTYPGDFGNRNIFDVSEDEIHDAFAKLRADNIAYIAKVEPAGLPSVKDSLVASVAPSMFRATLPDGAAFTTVMSFDMTASSEVKQATIVSRAGAVYSSADALYMAVPHQQGSYGWYSNVKETEISTLHKFSVGDAPSKTAYLASGIVKGRVLNQFSMDDLNGYLRIATTTGHLPSPDAHNTLSVLGQTDGALVLTGQVDHIAPTEDIRSVRFDGERGFMVTFKKTDPLYAFDLADPKNPRILGELKIPGFSTYMHLMDATHLLTIGYDAVDHGSFAYFDSVILQIFDVSDMKNPTLTYKYSIGTRGSSSEALADHHAFNYFAPLDRLAIPMTVCEGGGDGTYGKDMTFSGLMVFDVTAQSGFSLHGQVAHPNASTGTGYNSAGCSNWWSNATSEVKRSVFMDDWVYSISQSRVKVNSMSDLATDVVTLSLK